MTAVSSCALSTRYSIQVRHMVGSGAEGYSDQHTDLVIHRSCSQLRRCILVYHLRHLLALLIVCGPLHLLLRWPCKLVPLQCPSPGSCVSKRPRHCTFQSSEVLGPPSTGHSGCRALSALVGRYRAAAARSLTERLFLKEIQIRAGVADLTWSHAA